MPTSQSTPMVPGRELVLVRSFDAPRSLVFKVWTDPTHLARWWGPQGFTNPVCEADARPGGAIRIDMTGPDGTVYPMTGVFHEVVEPERLVFTCYAHFRAEGDPSLRVLNRVTFEEHDGKTTLTVRALVVKAGPESADALAGMEVGWNQTLDRLGDEVARAQGETKAFVITRTFDAPRDLVFRAWTESDRLAHWFGPKGFTMLSSTLDLRPGGVYHYGMRSPDGAVMWGRWVFREVVPPERLTFAFFFSDEAGGVTRHPFAPEWPAEVLSTVSFTEHDGKTTLTMHGVPVNATAAEQHAFTAGHDSMQQGWTGTLDALATYLAHA
jgi:uncharacterized protein YndB with AHSA1/START domain